MQLIKSMKESMLPLLATLLVSVFPAVFLYCQNADEADFSEIVPALLVCAGVGLLLLALATVVTRSPVKAAIITALLMMLTENFTFIENAIKTLLPSLHYWHTVPIVLVVALHIAWAVHRFIKKKWADDIVFALCVGFGALIVVNTVMAAPKIATRLSFQRQEQMIQQQNQTEPGELLTDLPNIYMFIFDEYANFPQLEEYYDYDNKPLKEFLEKNSFSVDYTGHNESILSATIQTNLVSLNYLVTNSTPPAERDVLRKNGKLFDVMREQGYKVDILESEGFYGGHMPNGETGKGGAATINGDSLRDLLVKQCIFYPFLNEGTHADAVGSRITLIADYLSDPVNLPAGGTFTLSYFCFPHQSFQVDENGDTVPIDHWEDWEDQRYYRGQYIFATKQMLRMAENIVENDPEAIIWLLSDHSARSGLGTSAPQLFPLEVMNNAFNAVRIPGDETLDIEGLSLVNTARTICNHLFGTEFDMLEVPPDDISGYYWGGGMLDEN